MAKDLLGFIVAVAACIFSVYFGEVGHGSKDESGVRHATATGLPPTVSKPLPTSTSRQGLASGGIEQMNLGSSGTKQSGLTQERSIGNSIILENNLISVTVTSADLRVPVVTSVIHRPSSKIVTPFPELFVLVLAQGRRVLASDFMIIKPLKVIDIRTDASLPRLAEHYGGKALIMVQSIHFQTIPFS